jgi:hypothetical protein
LGEEPVEGGRAKGKSEGGGEYDQSASLCIYEDRIMKPDKIV